MRHPAAVPRRLSSQFLSSVHAAVVLHHVAEWKQRMTARKYAICFPTWDTIHWRDTHRFPISLTRVTMHIFSVNRVPDYQSIASTVIIIIMNISPRKLIQEPQMRSCSSHLSNKNVLSSFQNESKLNDGSFILAGRSFQIVGPQTLNDLGPNVTVLVLGMYSCPEVADRSCLWPGIAETTVQSAAR